MARRTSTVKKTYNLPPDLVARVKRRLRAATETEAIVRCMEQVAHMEDVEKAIRAVSAKIPRYRSIR